MIDNIALSNLTFYEAPMGRLTKFEHEKNTTIVDFKVAFVKPCIGNEEIMDLAKTILLTHNEKNNSLKIVGVEKRQADFFDVDKFYRENYQQ